MHLAGGLLLVQTTSFCRVEPGCGAVVAAVGRWGFRHAPVGALS